MSKRFISLFIIFITVFASCNRTADKKENQVDTTDKILIDTISKPIDTISAVQIDSVQVETLQQAILNITRAYTSHDSKTLNQYIDNKIGYYTIYRPGVQEVYVHDTKIDFNKPIPDYYQHTKSIFSGKLIFAQLPIYDCGKESWSKKGLFCNNKQHPTELSRTAKYMNELQDAKISATEIQKLKDLESKSYRVILADENNPLVFHITKNGEKWILTVLDRAYGGCDA